MKKYLLLIFFITTIGCADLPRDNTLDPKNPDAEADQVAVVENFIMHYTNFDSIPNVIQYSQEASYELKGDFGGKVLILEYHMTPSDNSLEDSLSSPDIDFRYTTEYRGSTPRGFPHTFFNGKQTWIQGASSKATVKDRYKLILDSLTLKKVKLYCEGQTSFNADTLTVGGQIARYGDSNIENLVVEMVVIEDKGDYLHYVVREALLPQSITSITPKTIHDLIPRAFVIPAGSDRNSFAVVILVKDNISKKILQAALAE
ncbi:hypothetical protein F9K33_02455 [bacterium]|nr:MAG: hypothetical protein F9K33_02455 [bacterium]